MLSKIRSNHAPFSITRPYVQLAVPNFRPFLSFRLMKTQLSALVSCTAGELVFVLDTDWVSLLIRSRQEEDQIHSDALSA
ncbi:hypothetical protein MUP95_06300 [bacterium]|nr:hypothetical protein [bacterium]